MVFRTEPSSACEFKGSLKDVAEHFLNVGRCQTVTTLQIQHRLQDGLTMDERTVFLHDSLRDDFERGILPIRDDRLCEHQFESVRAFEQASWTRETTLGQ